MLHPTNPQIKISHSALQIANELAHTHNAMLRGLNVIYLQAPFVRLPADIADLLFLAQAWSSWVLDHHEMKESAMMPEFEAVLGLEPGALSASSLRRRNDGANEDEDDSESNGKRKEEEDLPTLLQHVRDYAASTLPQPTSYSPSTLQALLSSLASALVPHLHGQIPLLTHMRELCNAPGPSSTTPFSTSTPSSSSSSTPSAASSSHSLSKTAAAAAKRSADRANALTQIHGRAEAALGAAADRFVVPPMLVRLRHVAYAGSGDAAGWPRLSVPALHAVADRLSPRHAGAWRFLPCDVWGRRRELGFLGEGAGEN